MHGRSAASLVVVVGVIAASLAAPALALAPNQVITHLTKKYGNNKPYMGSDHFQVCPVRGDGVYSTWFKAAVTAPKNNVFMDLKIWIQAYKENGITGRLNWSDVKDNHRRTPDLRSGQYSFSKIALSVDLGDHPELQGHLVRQKFRIRWKTDRPGPDPVLYGYDGYTDTCSLPIETGGLVPGVQVPQINSGGGGS